MRHHFQKLSLFLIGLAAVVGVSATTSDAGIIPWVYDAIFGPNYPHYGYGPSTYAAYPPVATAPMTYAAPAASPAPCGSCSPTPSCGPVACRPRLSFFGPMCLAPCPISNPCSSCSPCGSPGACSSCGIAGGCPDGSCGLPSSSTTEKIEPRPAPKTFADEPPKPKESDAGSNPSIGDEGFRPRTEEPGSSSTEIDAFKPPETIKQHQPAPVDEPGDTAEPIKKNEKPEAESKEAPAESTELPPFSMNQFDQKITWSIMPVRTRTRLHARFTLPTVTRTIPNHNRNWQPVRQDTRMASN